MSGESLWGTIRREDQRITSEKPKDGKVQVKHVVITKDTGRYTIADPLRFGVAYKNKPDLRVLPEVDIWDDDSLPAVSAGVREWIQDENGFYVGAYIWLVVT